MKFYFINEQFVMKTCLFFTRRLKYHVRNGNMMIRLYKYNNFSIGKDCIYSGLSHERQMGKRSLHFR